MSAPRPPRRPGASPRYNASARLRSAPELPRGLALRVAGVLGLWLVLAWVLQFVTTACDHHPGLRTLLAAGSMGLAIATFVLAWREGLRRPWVAGGTLAVVLGSMLVLAWGASYRATLDGAPGYTLPHRPMSYPPEAKEISLTAADGVPLRATYLGGKSGHGIVLVPGWASTRHGFAIASLAMWLAPRFDVLVLDPRGTGESGGWLTPDLKGRYDLLAAIAYLDAQGANAIGVLAEREASLMALAALREAPQVKSMVLAAPPGRWGEPPLTGSWGTDPGHGLGRLWWRLGGGVRIAGGSGPETAQLLAAHGEVPLLLAGSREEPRGLLRQLHMLAPEPRSLRLFRAAGTPVAWADVQDYYHTVAQWFDLTLAEVESRASVGTESVRVPVGTESVRP